MLNNMRSNSIISTRKNKSNEASNELSKIVLGYDSHYDDTYAKFIIDDNGKVTYEGAENPEDAIMIIVNKSTKPFNLQQSHIDKSFIFPYAHNGDKAGYYFNVDRGCIDALTEYNLGIKFSGNAKTYELGWNTDSIEDTKSVKWGIKSFKLFRKDNVIVGGEIKTFDGNIINVEVEDI